MTGKPSIVFLPGMLCDESLWASQVKDLYHMADSRVHALTEDDSILSMAQRVLSNAQDRFVLCGLSLGGYVAMEIMRLAPERIQKLILADTSARADDEQQRKNRLGLLQLAALGRFKGVTPRLLPSILAKESMANDSITSTVLEMAQRIGREAYIRQQKAIIGRIDSRDSVKKISCPVLVLVGAEDRVTPLEHAVEMATLIPQSILEVVEFAGHLPPLEQPAVVSNLVKAFIEK